MIDYQKLDIKEMSLSGNMQIDEMQSRKVVWKTLNYDLR